MELCFIEAAMRHRYRGLPYKTIWGVLLLFLAYLVMLIGLIIASGKKRHKKTSIISKCSSIAIVIAVISLIVDIIMRKE